MRAIVILIFLVGACVRCLPVPAMAESLTKVEYVGGTMPDIRPGDDLRISVEDPSALTIATKQVRVDVVYSRVNQLEYGQKIGRNLVGAIVISPLFLLQKTRKHFVTLGYRDEQGQQQAVVLRVGKSDVRAVLASLEARTGLKVQFLDDESRKM